MRASNWTRLRRLAAGGAAAAAAALSGAAFAADVDAGLADNPLVEAWTGPFETPPFAAMKPEHFVPAFEHAMALHNDEIAAIAGDPAAPTFANTIEALERAGRDLSRIQRALSAFTGSASNDEIRAVQAEMAPKVAGHFSAIALNADLFARIDALWDQVDDLDLTDEQKRVLERRHIAYVRAGAELEGDDRARFGEIRSELAGLYTAFSQNVTRDTEAFTLVLDPETDVAGLPDAVLSAARQAGADREMEGQLVVTLARSSFEPFMTFSTRRDLREQLWLGWTNRGDNANAFDNKENIRRILALRLEQANLLGFENWAAFRTADTMAATPQGAQDLLDEVWAGALAKANAEEAEIRAAMVEAGAEHELEPWDWWFYAEKARGALYDVDEEAVKSHLVLDNMIAAQFAVAERLFGVTAHERDDIAVYHPDVRVWEIKDAAGESVGLFYGDYFARPGKRGGAWKSALRVQANFDGGRLPLIMNNCNYNKPVAGRPALISLREAETMFHEFGHGLHGLLSDVGYPSIAGTSVDRDFVEFPAQIYEHWIREPAIIQEFGRHYSTGEPMPQELLRAMNAAANAKSGFDNVEYIASGFVDLAYHRITDPAEIEALDVTAFEDAVLEAAGMPAAIEMRHRSPHFRHSFAGELYAGGYYTYLWAGVLDNDGYAAFEEAGDPFDPALAQKLYEEVFSAGNSQPAAQAYEAFRGRAPTTEALMRNRGLTLDPADF